MFVRINESGGRRDLQIVESCRNEAGKPRHRVVANLGRIDGTKDDHLDALIRGLCRVTGRDEPAKLEISHAPARAFDVVLDQQYRDLASMVGLPEDVLKALSNALGEAPNDMKNTVAGICDWMFAWLDVPSRMIT